LAVSTSITSEDIIPLTLFAGLSAFWTWLSWSQGPEALLGDAQNVLLMVLKQTRPELFLRDGVFYESEKFLFYTPLYRHYLALCYQFTGDLTSGLKFLVFPLNFVFMVGAYGFFNYLCNNRLIAATLAIFASLPLIVQSGGGTAGIGPIRFIAPRTIFYVFLPFLFLWFMKHQHSRSRLLLLFAVIGLLANLHPPSGFVLVQVLALAFLFVHRFSWWSIKTAILAGLVSIPGALPIIFNYLGKTSPVDFSGLSYATVKEILLKSFPQIFYPLPNLKSLPAIVTHLLTMLLLALSFGALWSWKRLTPRLVWLTAVGCLGYSLYFDREMNFYLIFLGFCGFWGIFPKKPTHEIALVSTLIFTTFWVGMGGLLLTELTRYLLKYPLDLEYNYVMRFFPLLLFALLGETMVSLKKLSPGWHPLKLTGLALLVLTLFMNLRWNYRTLVRARPPESQVAMVELANWARKHTDPEALFLFDSLTFRLLAQRSITGCYKDRGINFYAGHGFLTLLQHLQQLSAAQNQPTQLYRLARQHGADFVVVKNSSKNFSEVGKIVYNNEHYQVLKVNPCQ